MILHYIQKAMFAYNFNSGVNCCGENFAGNLFRGKIVLQIVKKKTQKLEPAKI